MFLLQAAPITGAVLLVSGIWYVAYAHKVYKGPRKLASLAYSCACSAATDVPVASVLLKRKDLLLSLGK